MVGCWLAACLCLVFMGQPKNAAAIERNRKNLLKVQLKSEKEHGKIRVVMRLNQGGYYEIAEDREKQRLLIKLYEFHNFGAEPLNVVEDPLLLGVDITDRNHYLEVALRLKTNSYAYNASLFETPAMCVIDLRVLEPGTELSVAAAPLSGQAETLAAGDTVSGEKAAASPPGKVAAAASSPLTALKTEGAESLWPGEKEVVSRIAALENPVADLPMDSGKVLLPETEAAPVGKDGGPLLEMLPLAGSKIKTEPMISTEVPPPLTQPASGTIADPSAPLSGPALVVPTAPFVQEAEPGKRALAEAEAPGVGEAESRDEALLSGGDEKPIFGADATGLVAPENLMLPGQDLFAQGLKAYAEEDYAAAVDFFSKIDELFPDSPLLPEARFRAYDARAQMVLKEDDGREKLIAVIDDFLAAARAHADHQEAPWAFLQVARLYEKMEFYDEGAGLYRALLLRYPGSPFAEAANFALARLNFFLKRYDDALNDFSTLLERQPEGGFAVYSHYYRANTLVYLGRPRQALEDYRVGIEKNPVFLQNDALSLYLLGTAYHGLGRFPEAKEYFFRMRSLFPGDIHTPLALAKIGEILLLEGKPAEAMSMFMTTVKEYPESEGDIVSRLKMAILGQDEPVRERLLRDHAEYTSFMDCEKAYLYLLEKHPESPYTAIARLDLGQLYLGRQEYRKARLVLDEMLSRQLEPGLREAAFTTLRETLFAEIRALHEDRKNSEIVALQIRYGEDFLSRPTSVYPFLWVGEALHEEGCEAAALKVYQEVDKLKPDYEQSLKIKWGLADLLCRQKSFGAAETLMGGLEIDRMPPFWRARMLLLRSRLQSEKGQLPEALATLGEVRRLLPQSAVKERVAAAELEAELWLRREEKTASRESLSQAVKTAFLFPGEIPAARRLLLGYRLARVLFEERDYEGAVSWFAKLALLAAPEEAAELLYWQLLCQVALGREPEVDTLLRRLQQGFQASSWTAAARVAVDDFRWRQENSSLK